MKSGKKKKRFFASHAKSSAALVSLAIHAVLILVALSFVAVTVIQKEDKVFEAKPVNRPQMKLKKLQVPVNIKKKKMQKPKLRKRIVVAPKLNQTMPDIKMPEITGVKGGLGAAGAGGLGAASGVGFSMPEINVFGIKGKGEKVFLMLDSDAIMMRDEVGGMTAYTLIKTELSKIVGSLSPASLFNIAVFDHHHAMMLFPQMSPANPANIDKIGKWLEPLNKVSEGMADKAYGVKTVGAGGVQIAGELERGKIQDGRNRHWFAPSMAAMQQQADTVFILTGWWGVQRHAIGKTKEWSASKRKRWEDNIAKGNELLAKENRERAARGEPPRVIRDNYMLIAAYFPDTERPPEPDWYWYTPKDFAEALYIYRKESANPLQAKSGISKKKNEFSLNVIYFTRPDEGPNELQEANFRKLVSLCKGEYKTIAGLEAIKSSVSGGE